MIQDTREYALLRIASRVEDPRLKRKLVTSAYVIRNAGIGGTMLDVGQLTLDALGFVPGLGEIADGINALIALARKDFFGAAMSVISMIPEAGDAVGKGGKLLRWIIELSSSPKLLKGAAKFILKNGGMIKKTLKAFVSFIQTNMPTIQEYLSGFQDLANGKVSEKAPDAIKATAIKAAKVPKIQAIARKAGPSIGSVGKEITNMIQQSTGALQLVDNVAKQAA